MISFQRRPTAELNHELMLQDFRDICKDRGLFNQPISSDASDTDYGLTDNATLLYGPEDYLKMNDSY